MLIQLVSSVPPGGRGPRNGPPLYADIVEKLAIGKNIRFALDGKEKLTYSGLCGRVRTAVAYDNKRQGGSRCRVIERSLEQAVYVTCYKIVTS
jgi:hypothetical protein